MEDGVLHPFAEPNYWHKNAAVLSLHAKIKTFTIRKMSGTIGVERIFPINLPALQKIEVNKRGKVRRARIFYFRELTGKKARIKEQTR